MYIINSLIDYRIAGESDLLDRPHLFLSIFLGLAQFNIPSFFMALRNTPGS